MKKVVFNRSEKYYLRHSLILLQCIVLFLILQCNHVIADGTSAPVVYDKAVRIHNSHYPFEISLHATDADSDQVSFELVSPPSHGEYFVEPSDQLSEQTKRTGGITYIPEPGYVGPDHFTYKAIDENGDISNVAEVALEILPPVENPYVPPIGIPKPEFGIEETHLMYEGATYDYNGNPGPYKDGGNGPYTHYIDNTDPDATDTNNPYGTVDLPRKSLPKSSDVQSGAVIEIHGGPYTTSQIIIRYNGTVEQPVFVRGAGESIPVFDGQQEIYMAGHYVIWENLKFDKKEFISRKIIDSDDVHHISVRNCQTNMAGLGSISYIDNTQVHNQVLYNNSIKADDFDPEEGSFAEDDTVGVYCSLRTNRVWVLDNDIYQAKGDAVGGGHGVKYLAANYYIGRNKLHQCGENAVDLKEVENIIISENKMYDMRGWSSGAGGNGTTVVVHYGPTYSPRNVWMLFNEIYDADGAIQAGGDQEYPVYIIGNVIHDIHDGSGTGDSFRTWNCQEVYMNSNVFYDVDSGIDWGVQGDNARLIFNNNIMAYTSDNGYALKVEATAQRDRAVINSNLFYHEGSPVNIIWGSSDLTLDELKQTTGKAEGCIEANPMFVSAENDNYKLQKNSPAIDKGIDDDVYQAFEERFGINIKKDFDGKDRPQGEDWDIGAYEYTEVDNSSWVPPIGIPDPGFGIKDKRPDRPTDWSAETAGYYYINQETGSDTYTYGTPSTPRKSIPRPIPAGSYVEVHGEYTAGGGQAIWLECQGTDDDWTAGTNGPVWIVGLENDVPYFTQQTNFWGSYAYIEGINFLPSGSKIAYIQIGSENTSKNMNADHMVIRNCDFRGDSYNKRTGVMVAGTTNTTVKNVVVYNNYIHDYGDMTAHLSGNDQDSSPMTVGEYVSNLWVLDNVMHTCSAGLRVGGQHVSDFEPGQLSNHIYVSRNIVYNTVQAGLAVKQVSDVVFSENVVHDVVDTEWSEGKGIGFQYRPTRFWVLFNTIYDCRNGVFGASDEHSFETPVYIIGNVIYDTHEDLSFDAGISIGGSTISSRYIIGNTIYNKRIGIKNGYGKHNFIMSNNIIQGSIEADIKLSDSGTGSNSILHNTLFSSPARIDWGDGVVRSLNEFQQEYGKGVDSMEGDAMFVNAANYDFRLQENSPAINTGIDDTVYQSFQDLYGIDIRVDKDGNLRPQNEDWDIGAYEYVEGSAPESSIHAIVPGNTYNGDGSSWAAASADGEPGAYNAIPDNLNRGDTYYFADGDYPTYIADDELDGTKYITFKKATESDHGTDEGWKSEYGDGRASFKARLVFRRGYYKLDGNKEFDYWSPESFGFDFISGATNWSRGIYIDRVKTDISHITINDVYIDMSQSTGWDSIDVKGIKNDNGDNITISNVYIKNFGDGISTDSSDNSIYEYIYFYRTKLPDGCDDHGDALVFASGSNSIVRYSRFNWNGQQIFFSGKSDWTYSNFKIYGNLFYTDEIPSASAKGVVQDKDDYGPIVNDCDIINNTFYNLWYPIHPRVDGTFSGVAKNNIFINNKRNPVYRDLISHDYNLSDMDLGEEHSQIADSSIFVDASEYNFSLKVATDSADNTVGSEYNRDMTGKVRGVDGNWDRGAYEYKDNGLTITKQPIAHTVEVGQDVTLSVEASGSGLEYQWQYKGQNGYENLPDENTDTLTITNIQINDEGYYQVEVSDSQKTVSSDEVFLNVIDGVPEVNNLSCTADMKTIYLAWDNPDEEDNDWNKVIVVRKMEVNPTGPDDGEEIYNGTDDYVTDSYLDNGEYHYAVYAYIETDTDIVYSSARYAEAIISDISNKKFLRIDSEDGRIKIGQNTRGDLYSLWNEKDITIGRGPTGNNTSFWLSSDIIGNGEDQIPAGSQIVSARLVFTVKDYSFDDNSNEDNSDNENSDLFMNSDNVGNPSDASYIGRSIYGSDAHSIKLYQISDPDRLGVPQYASESGIRVGLDFNYRDHRPGMNIPWVEDGSIESLLDDSEAVDIVEFSPEVFLDGTVRTLQLDITETVQRYSKKEAENTGDGLALEKQGIYINTDYGWSKGEWISFYGTTVVENEEAETEDGEKGIRPYLEIIYSDGNGDLTAPASVQGLTIKPGETSAELSWTNPDDTDFAGIKLIRREGIIPYNLQDGSDGENGAFVDFVENVGVSTGAAIKYTDSNLLSGHNYYYVVYVYDREHNYSQPLWIKGVPGSPASAPTFNTSDIAAGKVTLSWNKVTGADSYNIYYIDGKNNNILIDEIVDENQTAQNVPIEYTDYVPTGEYTYQVSAVNENGEGPLSNGISVNITDDAAEKPAKPTELTVEVISSSEIKLNWIDQSNNEIGFVVERKNGDAEWQEIGKVRHDKTEFVDKELLPATQYTYRIKAFNSAGENYSDNIDITTEDGPVQQISWQLISASQIKVEWEDITDAVSYRVAIYELDNRREMGSNKIGEDDEPLDTQMISNAQYCYFVNLEPGKEYKIRIISLKNNEEIGTAESDIVRTSMDSKGGLF